MKKDTRKTWSPNGYLFAAFRKVWRWSPVRKTLLKEGPDGKLVCAECNKRFNRESVAVDHKEPVIEPQKGFEGWDIYYKRLFCPITGLQVLCKACHSQKTRAENKIRRQRRKAA